MTMDGKYLVFLLCFCFGSANITILDLKVPQSIESGTVDDVILDCDFDAGDDEGIEVKWFINGLNEQIYQWIPETNKPGQAIGRFKDFIDVNYKISNDKNTMYRALHLIDISPELSGNYSCKVSGYKSEDFRTKSMIIYEPADAGLDLKLGEIDSVVMCSSEGIFPRPNMTLYITTADNETDIVVQQDEETLEFNEDTGVYNVSSTLYFDPANLTSPFYYICELSIPDTSYVLTEKKLHRLAVEELETQIEDDYLNVLNATNSTESPVNDSQEFVQFETQIEEDNTHNTTSAHEVNIDIDNHDNLEAAVEANNSSVHLLACYLLPTTIMILLSSLLKS